MFNNIPNSTENKKTNPQEITFLPKLTHQMSKTTENIITPKEEGLFSNNITQDKNNTNTNNQLPSKGLFDQITTTGSFPQPQSTS